MKLKQNCLINESQKAYLKVFGVKLIINAIKNLNYIVNKEFLGLKPGIEKKNFLSQETVFVFH